MSATPSMTATCRCGNVALEAIGEPIMSTVCYCADCQLGSREIEALPNAGPVRDADGGTAYTLFRKDRVQWSRGSEFLKSYKLNDRSPTNRVVATCCNSAMVVNFDRGPHWVSAYTARFGDVVPPPQMRICTKSKGNDVVLPNDVPGYPGYPPALIFRLLASRLAMFVGR